MVNQKRAEDISENLKISVRIRPFKADEVAKKYTRVINSVDNNMITLHEEVPTKLDALREKRRKEQNFAYDFVFSETSTQDAVYSNTTKPLIPDVVKGFNATVFAYGPTGTGKTYTMVGTPSQPGIMIRALNDLFKLMQKGEENFTVYMSYLEIYNEVIRDLLVSKAKPLELREDAKTGIIQVAGLTEISTTSTNEVMKLLQIGNQRRSCESTAANATSSRSHALLQINVRLSSHTKSAYGEEVKMGRLFMVDLAGSERAKNTQNVGKRLQEGAHINKSLLALGNVINALAEGGVKYVNFRDSKLTRLLKDALTGNCKTVMIAHVSPLNIHREESRNTLIYADRAKKISTKTRQNKVDVSYHITQYQTIISELQEEIKRLKGKLEENGEDDYSGDGKTGKGNAQQIALWKNELVQLFKEQMELRKALMNIETNLAAISIEFSKQNDYISEYEAERASMKNKRKGSKGSLGMDSGKDDDSGDELEPEDITLAWEDLIYLQSEEKRYTEMRENIMQDLDELKEKSQEIEEQLPSKITSEGQRELLTLLCKVHELQIKTVELESKAVLKEHELYRRDLMLLRFDRQRSLCDQIITKQRSMLENGNKNGSLELEKLYTQYQELNLLNSDKNSNDWSFRSQSVMSNKGSKLPPINKEPEKLFKPRRRFSLSDDKRISTPLYIRSPTSPARSAPSTARDSCVPSLPPIKHLKDSSTGIREIKQGVRNSNSTRRNVRYISLQKPSSFEEIILLESPKNKTNEHRNNKRLPMHLRDTHRRGSLPILDVASFVKSQRTSQSGSEDESPQRRGRLKSTKVKSEGSLTLRRRGKSLTRVSESNKPNKGETDYSLPDINSNHLPVPPIRHMRSKSDDQLSKLSSTASKLHYNQAFYK